MVSSDFHFLKHIIIHWRLCLYLLEMTQRRQNWISKQSVPKGQDRTFKCYQNVVFFAQFSFRTKFHWHWHFILNNYHILVGKAVWFYFFLFFIFFKMQIKQNFTGFPAVRSHLNLFNHKTFFCWGLVNVRAREIVTPKAGAGW